MTRFEALDNLKEESCRNCPHYYKGYGCSQYWCVIYRSYELLSDVIFQESEDDYDD